MLPVRQHILVLCIRWWGVLFGIGFGGKEDQIRLALLTYQHEQVRTVCYVNIFVPNGYTRILQLVADEASYIAGKVEITLATLHVLVDIKKY